MEVSLKCALEILEYAGYRSSKSEDEIKREIIQKCSNGLTRNGYNISLEKLWTAIIQKNDRSIFVMKYRRISSYEELHYRYCDYIDDYGNRYGVPKKAPRIRDKSWDDEWDIMY